MQGMRSTRKHGGAAPSDLGCDPAGRQYCIRAGGVYVLEVDGHTYRVCRLRSPNRVRVSSRPRNRSNGRRAPTT